MMYIQGWQNSRNDHISHWNIAGVTHSVVLACVCVCVWGGGALANVWSSRYDSVFSIFPPPPHNYWSFHLNMWKLWPMVGRMVIHIGITFLQFGFISKVPPSFHFYEPSGIKIKLYHMAIVGFYDLFPGVFSCFTCSNWLHSLCFIDQRNRNMIQLWNISKQVKLDV